MSSKLMQALQATPNGRGVHHGQDLSSFIDFHHKAGQYMVVDCRDTVPDSWYEMGVDGFTRTKLCNTANFAHIKENYYFIHVPLGLINRNAYQLQVDRKQEYSALDMGITSFPYFPLQTVVARLFEISQLDTSQTANKKWLDIHGFNMAYGAIKLLDMLGYGYFGDLLAAIDADAITVDDAKDVLYYSVRNKYPSVARIGAYQCTWYHFFRNDIYDVDVSAKCFNFDDVSYSDGVNPVNYDVTQVRSVDDFIHDCLQLRYVGYKKDIFTASMPGTQYGPVSTVPVNVQFDDLTASFTGTSVTPTGSFTGTAVTPTGSFTGTAAQIKPGSLVENEITLYDHFTGHDIYNSDVTSVNAVSTGTDRGKHRVADTNGAIINKAIGQGSILDSDLYTPMAEGQPMTGLSHVSQATPPYFDQHDHLVPYHRHIIKAADYTPSGGVSINSITPSGSISINSITPTGTVNLSGGATSTSLFDVLSLVEAQAIQKWRQKSMLAGNKTADQFRAHHGVVPRHLIDHLPDFIGSVDNEIHVTEITSQADTASSPNESNLGEIRGRGYGASDARSFRFYSDDYGVLLLIHAIVPENVYDSYGIDKGNTMLQYTDFFQSEFMNIGLEAVPKYLLAPAYGEDTPSSPSQEGGDTFNSSVGLIGYAPRYYNYKQYPSKVHGLFNSSRLLIGSTPFDPASGMFGYADMQSFVLPRRDMTSFFVVAKGSGVTAYEALTMTLSSIYVNPKIFDSIFGVEADNSELTDLFFSHVKFYCKASLPMSNLGLPQF
jgi:hypothetical protein